VSILVGMVGFCGSRALSSNAEILTLVAGVVGSVLAGGREVAVGCAVGGDDLVVSSSLAAGASSRLRVFAVFGPVSPSLPDARVFAPGASSSVSGVASALAAGASVSLWSGGEVSVPLVARLASRSKALVEAVAGKPLMRSKQLPRMKTSSRKPRTTPRQASGNF